MRFTGRVTFLALQRRSKMDGRGSKCARCGEIINAFFRKHEC